MATNPSAKNQRLDFFTKNQPIRKILIVGSIGVLIFAFALTLVIVIISANQFLTTKTGKSFLALAQSNSQQFSDEIASEMSLLGTLTQNDMVYMYLRDEFDPEIANLSKVERQALILQREQKWLNNDREVRDSVTNNILSQGFTAFIRKNFGVSEIVLVDKEGRAIASGGTMPDHYYFGEQKWFKDVSNGMSDIYLEEPAVSSGQNKSEVEIILSVNLPSFSVSRGYLYAKYDISQLKLFSTILLGDPNVHMSLVNQNGLVLFDTVAGQIGGNLSAVMTRQTSQEAAPNWHLGQDASRTPLIYSYAPIYFNDLSINHLSWSIFVRETSAQAFSFLTVLSLTIFFIAIFIFILSSLVIFWLASGITRPITNLLGVVEEFTAGNYSQRAEESGPYEFKLLGASFNKMVDSILAAEKKRLEAERIKREAAEKYAKKLEDLDKTKDNFINIVTHELKTPLIPILGLTDVMVQKKKTLSADFQNYVDIIHDEAIKLSDLIKQMLTTTRIQNNMKIQEETFKIDEFISGNQTALNELTKRTGSKIEYKINAANVMISSDKERISQVIYNLVDNAVKYGPVGQTITITLSQPDSQSVKVEVADQGKGIPVELRDKLFLKFSQLDPAASRAGEGVGLGLYICKQNIDHLGGRIGLESEVGHGSKFYFVLPLRHELKDNISNAANKSSG
ncbi:MAG: sensor histidine kinase [Patescibacteria group bacterium]|nr:sensor histidine kinase [Patescibacteria group bacterium]